MKQTAVEWLESELKKLPMVNIIEVFKQAKQMEKEQIEDAVNQHYVIPSNYYYKTYGNKS